MHDNTHPNHHHHRSFMALTVGALLGMAAGILVAPRSGRENRETLKRRALQVKQKIDQDRNTTISEANDVLDHAREAAHEKLNTGF
jgi:gas vesicle protein